jgi:uroporphyrinogen III methyltransferase/synthase
MTESNDPLAGRTVLITRPQGRSEGLIRRLTALKACPVAWPTVAFETPSDPQRVRSAITALADYDWLVFTSHNGVEYFFRAVDAMGDKDRHIPGKIASIGPATAATLTGRGVVAELVATDSRSEGLSAELCDRIGAGQRVLLIKPEASRDVIERAVRDRGSQLDAVAFYRNVPAPGVEDLVRAIVDAEYDMAVFSSPSTFLNLSCHAQLNVTALLAALNRMGIVAIGPVTADALGSAGIQRVISATQPTDDGIIEALRRAALAGH